MKIILNQDVPNLGEEGDVCVVKDGYARNFLLPTGAAVLYTKENLAIFKSRAAAIEKRKIAKREASASLKEKLDNVSLDMVVSAGDSGKLFGSVTPLMIQEALAKLGFDIEKKRIEVATHSIKMVGVYSAKIHLYENESSVIKLNVLSEAVVKAEEKAAKEAAAKEAAAAAKAEAEAAKAEEVATSDDVAPQAEAVEETPAPVEG